MSTSISIIVSSNDATVDDVKNDLNRGTPSFCLRTGCANVTTSGKTFQGSHLYCSFACKQWQENFIDGKALISSVKNAVLKFPRQCPNGGCFATIWNKRMWLSHVLNCPHLLSKDLSLGKESIPVTCALLEDQIDLKNRISLPKAEYITEYKPGDGLSIVDESGFQCHCGQSCKNAKCICRGPNEGRQSYDDIGRLLYKDCVLFECHKGCSCACGIDAEERLRRIKAGPRAPPKRRKKRTQFGPPKKSRRRQGFTARKIPSFERRCVSSKKELPPLNTPVVLVQENPKREGSMSWERYEKYKHARTLGEYLELGAKIADAFFDNSRGFLEFKLTPEEQKKKDEEEARIRALNEKEERRVQEEKEKWLMAEEERLSREYEAKMKVNNSADVVVSKENQEVIQTEEEAIPQKAPDHIPCRSRVVGPGRAKIAMQVISYGDKGFGVRTLEFIPKGSFVCEYMGEIITDLVAETRVNQDEYILNSDTYGAMIGAHETICCIDAGPRANIARYLNHSCEPNLLKQPVFCGELLELQNKREQDIVENSDWVRKKQGKKVLPKLNTSSPKEKRRKISSPRAITTTTEDMAVGVQQIPSEDMGVEVQQTPSILLESNKEKNESSSSDNVKKSKTKRGRKRKFKTKEEENASHINQMNETLDKVRSKRENAIPFIRLAFFAVRDIAPLEELCWDYGYKKGSVENKHLKCLCGTPSCREYLY